MESSSILLGLKIAGFVGQGEELGGLVLSLDGNSLGLANVGIDLVEGRQGAELVREKLAWRTGRKMYWMIVVLGWI